MGVGMGPSGYLSCTYSMCCLAIPTLRSVDNFFGLDRPQFVEHALLFVASVTTHVR